MKSEHINDIATALSKAQAKIQKASKDKVNPFYKSNYADLGNIVDVIKEPLAENNLAYVQINNDDKNNNVSVSTFIMHSSGQWINCGPVSFPVSKNDPQGYGSAITYARRYSLAAAFGVATEDEDDDGNHAAKSQKKVNKENNSNSYAKKGYTQVANKSEPSEEKATKQQIQTFKNLAIDLKIDEETIIDGFLKKGYKGYEDIPAKKMDIYIHDFLQRKAKNLEEKHASN